VDSLLVKDPPDKDDDEKEEDEVGDDSIVNKDNDCEFDEDDLGLKGTSR
jgi:hypothetical protein